MKYRLSWLAVVIALGTLLSDLAGLRAEEEVEIPHEEWTQIRKQDTVILTGGRRPIEGIILTPADSAEDLYQMDSIEIEKPGRIRLRLSTSEIEPEGGLILRQSAEQVYANLRQRWLTQITDDPVRRARAELAMARWCYYPHPRLGGEPPMASKALEHFENAVFLDPSLTAAYPYLVALFSVQNDLLAAEIDAIDREVEVYQLGRRNGYDHPALTFRLGVLLARRLSLPGAAVPLLEEVLASEEATDGQRRESRDLLAQMYLERNEPEKALALYHGGQAADNAETNESFESLYWQGRIRMRMGDAESRKLAHDLLERALKVQPEFVEILLDLAAIEYLEGEYAAAAKHIAAFLAKRPGDVMALVESSLIKILQGKYEDARKTLEVIVEQPPPVSSARAHLVSGFLRDLEGNLEDALSSYRAAVKLDPSDPSSRLLEAEALVRKKELAAARQALQSIRQDFAESREVFGACCRLLARVELDQEAEEKAEQWLEYAVNVQGRDEALLERAGLTFLALGKLDRATSLLESVNQAAPGRPATLNGLGYLRYQEGKIDEASELFSESERILKRLPRSERQGSAGKHLAYATQSLQQIRDLKDLEVWADEFEGADSQQIDGWEKIDRFGVDIVREGGRAVFRGVQKNSADGETALVLMRRIEARRFDRVSLRLRIAEGKVSPSLRLETAADSSRPSSGLMVYRDLDGLVKVQFKTTTASWKIPEVTPEEELEDEESGASSRRLRRARTVYRGGVAWGADSQFHTMEIRRSSDPSARSRSYIFDVFFDGQIVARNLSVPGLSGPEYEVIITGSTNALGNPYTLEVESLKVFREARGR